MQIRDGKVSITSTALAALAATVLSSGATTTFISSLTAPDPDQVAKIEALQERVDELEKAHEKDARTIALVYAIVRKAHRVSIDGIDGPVDLSVLPINDP